MEPLLVNIMELRTTVPAIALIISLSATGEVIVTDNAR